MKKKWLIDSHGSGIVKKWGRIMRITVALIFGLIMTVNANSYSQVTKLNIRLTDSSIREVIEYVEENSKFVFLYKNEDFNVDKKVDVNLKNATINEILDEVLAGEKIVYDVYDRQIVIRKYDNTVSPSQQQNKSVTGVVNDNEGLPLPGVTILIKGTTQGTVTNAEGVYSLSDIPDGATLRFSFVGMLTQEIEVGSQIVINVTMKMDAIGLEEVVAIGYGTQSRHTLTTSISKLDNDVLDNIPYANIQSAMTGNLAGVRVQNTSGQPGAPARIIIRGGTSINNPDGAEPLYVVDGVIRSDLQGINADDIKSIQVLKDASSTAIYGARGTNGVVLVETKSGKRGETRVSYRYDLTVSKTTKELDLLQGEDFVYYQRLGFARSSAIFPPYAPLMDGIHYSGSIGNDLTNNTWNSLQVLSPSNEHKLNEGWLSMPDPVDPSRTLIFSDTDWQDILFRTAISHNHSFSISGGNEKATFGLGIGYLSSEGIAIFTDYQRLTINMNGAIALNDKIKVFGKVMFSNSNNKQVPSMGRIFGGNVIASPATKRYFEDGTFAPGRSSSYANTEYYLGTFSPKNNTNDLTLITGMQWEILPDLTFDPQFSLYQRNIFNRNFQRAYYKSYNSYDKSRDAEASYAKLLTPQVDAVFNYGKSFNDVHNLNITAGLSYFSNIYQDLSAEGKDAATDLIPTLNASGTPVSVYGSENQLTLLGYFARVSYDFEQKYMFNASLRYDGASNLGAEHKWGAFPGISAGWNVHNEDFWSSDKTSLKLRASYGVTGNISGLGPYQAQGVYGTGSIYSGFAAIQNTVLPNQELQWEESNTIDFGVDFGLFNKRITVLADYYRRVTDNLLTDLSMPPSSGFSSILTNFGSLENKGFELELNAQVFPSSSEFQWNISFNHAFVKTIVLKLPENGIENNRVGGQYLWDADKGDYSWQGGLQEGQPIGNLYGQKQLSIFSTDAEALNAPYDELIPSEDKTKYGGDVNWFDADGNNVINVLDRVYVGNLFPTTTGGFSNYLSFKGISLNVRMDYTLGHTLYNETSARTEGNFSGTNSISSNVLRSWQEQGDVTDIPKYHWADQRVKWNVWNARQSSRFFEKMDFLCLREVTLSYSLPKSIIQKLRIADLRFNVTGSNLYYFTNYRGLNPEASGGSEDVYPNARNITIGAKISF